MQYVWYGIAGVLGGILGGMGMGGGTVLIPLLSIFYDVGQHTAQAINLISFIPMAVVALIIHIKNGYVKFKSVLIIVLPGLFTCVLGVYLARAAVLLVNGADLGAEDKTRLALDLAGQAQRFFQGKHALARRFQRF